MASIEGERPRARIAEARRNRQNLIAAATRAFASEGEQVPLEAIAKDAGVGIGTLYRHFPNREALVEAVYEDSVERLAASANELLAVHSPAEAFRSWMAVFTDWAATKHGMIDTLRALMSSGRVEHGLMRAQLVNIVSLFLSAGAAAGDLRTDVAAEDVAATLAGVLAVAGAPGQRAQAGRMLDIVLNGLRPGGATMNRIDTSKPHPARVYNYYLGGADNFPADRQVAEKAIEALPAIRTAARENRAFLGRAVRYLAADEGITQFLDLGSGLPTVGNVHEVAQAVLPGARIVYVDNDPIVLEQGRALLAGTPEGRCAYVLADIKDPEYILAHPVTRETLDFGRPVALILAAVLHFLLAEDDPGRIVRTLIDAFPSGSYVVVSHATAEYAPREVGGVGRAYQQGGMRLAMRDADEFARVAFTGLTLVPPGVVPISEWRPEPGTTPPSRAEVSVNGGVARKP
jgi:AcrR family transcriptional regulator